MINTKSLVGERYKASHLLGAGGMGRVYLAHDCSLLREVALKVLDERYAETEEFVERFRREAKAAASLSHPNIVAVYDYGEDERGAPYIAMEHVPGGTLKDRIWERGALPPRVAAGVTFEVANALAAAHERGIVHRDIKPENVLVTDQGHAKVGDFGIARAATATAITETNFILGTVRYLSPEQAKGEEVGPPSDLYSLGVVLYEMLTGRLPFEAENPIATAMKHVTEEPASPRELDPTIPKALEAITLKLLKKDPKHRYESATQLAEDLKRLLVGPIPAAVSDSRETRLDTEGSIEGASEKRRSHRKLLAALTLLALASFFVVLASSVGFGEESPFVPLIVGQQGSQAPVARASAPLPSGAENVALKPPQPPQMHTLQQQTLQQQTPQQKSSPSQGQGQNQQQQLQQPPQQSQAAPQPLTAEQISAQEEASSTSAASAANPEQKPSPASKLVPVPDLSGMSFEEAKAALSSIGLLIRTTGEQYSEAVAKGSVLSQDAPPGFEAQPGATVAVKLSSGPPSRSSAQQGGTDEEAGSIQGRVSASSSVLSSVVVSSPTDNTRAWVARNNRAISTPRWGATSSRR